MAKLYPLIFVSFFSLFSCSSLYSCSLFYGSSDTYENFDVYYNTHNNEAFVSGYSWPDQSNHDITIPDTYQNSETNETYTVTAMGGFFGRGLPCPFYVDIIPYISIGDSVDDYMTPYTEEDESNYANITYYDFTLNIGPHIKTIFVDTFIYVLVQTDGSKDGYIYRFYVTVDQNNSTFYSQDGKVYRTKDSSLYSDFIYY